MKKGRHDYEYPLLWALALMALAYFTITALTGCASPDIICTDKEFMDMGKGGMWRCRKWEAVPTPAPSPKPTGVI